MKHRVHAVLVLALGAASSALAPPLAAQQSATLRRAVKAYGDLSYGEAVGLARGALRERLSVADQERAFEVLGFAYAALDSARQATEAFKQLVLLSPDRDLDPARISPKITSLFALARAQVLVVRRLETDTAAFVAGVGSMPIRFSVTRSAHVRTRLVGPGGAVLVDSSLVEGTTRVQWSGLAADGLPARTGIYRVIVEASAGRDSYAASLPIRVVAGVVDSLPHLSALPGYELLPETVVPPRSWRPFVLSILAAAAVAGGSVALENGSLGGGSRSQLAGVSVGTALVGLLASAKRPAAVPSPVNIRYNALLREQLARRNGEIAAQNAARRRQVKLSVAPERTPLNPAPAGTQ